jgi:hypothetical protein
MTTVHEVKHLLFAFSRNLPLIGSPTRLDVVGQRREFAQGWPRPSHLVLIKDE